jgi:hypothetical protein
MATRDPDEIQASIDALEAEKDAIEDNVAERQRFLEVVKELAAAELELARVMSASTSEIQDAAKAYEESRKKLREFNDEVARVTPSFNSFDSALQNNIKTITGVEDASNTLIGSFAKLLGDTGDLNAVFDQSKETFKKTFNALNVGVSITRKFVESTVLVAKEIDAGIASFNKASGAGDLYNKQIQAAEKSNRQFGLSIEDIAEARLGLADGLSGFAVLQAQEQDRLIELSAQFTRLGVSTADFVGILETGTRVLGLNTRQVTEAAEEIRSFGQSIGVTTGKIMSEFNAALPALASFGAEATNIFKGLQLISQETGLATGELTSFADQFMSIETTARAVAGVQAVVGNIGIDQLTLLQKANEGQDAVIEYFRGALLQRGGYESLNRLQKVALANQLNIDEATLAGLMNTNNAIEEKTQLETDFNKALEAGIGLSEQFNILVKQLAIGIQPVVEGMTTIIGVLASTFGVLPGLIKGAIATASAVGGALLFAKRMSRGSTIANPVYTYVVNNPGGPGRGGGGFFGGANKMRLAGGAAGIGGGLALGQYGRATDNAAATVGGDALAGAGLGFMLGGPVGAVIGGLLGGGMSLASFDNGGGIAGSGPAPIMAHGGEVVVPVQQTPAAENLANMVAQKVSQTAMTLAAPTVQVYIGNEQIKDFITKTQNTNLGRAPNVRPAGGGVTP